MKEGWELKKLDDLFDVQSSKRVHKKDWQSEGVPFYHAREVVKLVKNGFVENELYISEELFNKFTKDKGAEKEDDIIISAVGTLGRCYLVKKQDKFYIKDASVLWLSKKGEINSRYIEYSFKAPTIQEQVLDRSMGATVGTLTISRAKNIKIPIPPLPEQELIVSILDCAFAAIDKAKANAEQNLQNAKELFESYLQGVFENADWETRTIQEITRVINGYAFKSKDFKPTNSIKSVKITNVGVKEFVAETDNYLPEAFGETLNKVQVKEGDIVIALTRTIISAGLKVAVVPSTYDGALVNQRVAALVANEENVNPSYLYYFLTTKGVADYVLAHVNTLMQPNLSINDLKTLPVPLPSTDEQESIVRHLDAMQCKTQELEAVYQQKLDDLEELKKSILQKAFAGELDTETLETA